MITRRRLLATAAAGALASPALGQSRTLRLIVPFPPGGTTDVLARLLAQAMGEMTGQVVVVENRPGAGGAIGADALAKSAPDGATLMVTNASFPFNSLVLEVAGRATYRFPADFAPVTQLVNVDVVLLAPAAEPASDLRAYVERLRGDRSLRHLYGSTGPGSFLHLVFEILKAETGVALEQVAYRGAAPLVQDLIAGRINIGGDQLPTSLGHLRSGTVKALATTSSRRIAQLPNIPTVADLGLGAIEIDSWNGVFAPAGTPVEIIRRRAEEIEAALRRADIQTRLGEMTLATVGGGPERMAETVTAQTRRFRPTIERLRIDPQG